MQVKLTIIAAALAAGVSACEPAPPVLSPDFGYSVGQNMAVHTVQPRQFRPAEMDGVRAALRQEQYRKGTVIPVREPGTTGTIAGGRSGN
jgi:hypothetical protein